MRVSDFVTNITIMLIVPEIMWEIKIALEKNENNQIKRDSIKLQYLNIIKFN